MAHIDWDQSLSVNVDKLDRQHQDLFSLFNKLHDLIATDARRLEINRHLTGLIRHTREHFAEEEQLMKKLAYPGYAEHQQEHEELLQSLIDYRRCLDSGEQLAPFELLTFLRDWILDHLLGPDQEMGLYCQHLYLKAQDITP